MFLLVLLAWESRVSGGQIIDFEVRGIWVLISRLIDTEQIKYSSTQSFSILICVM